MQNDVKILQKNLFFIIRNNGAGSEIDDDLCIQLFFYGQTHIQTNEVKDIFELNY